MVTALARVEGRAVGVIANDCRHLGGAITSVGASKATGFIGLCDRFAIPLVALCDTPGIMVGAEAERTGVLGAASRLFSAQAALRSPLISLVLRRWTGIGGLAMMAGTMRRATAHRALMAWPSGEFAGMGIEGQVRLQHRARLEAVDDPSERQRLFRHLVDDEYATASAITKAESFFIDDVIDPAQTRRWIALAFA